MTVACSLPNGDLGIALRLSTFLDCQARALGENGFQAFAGGPVVAGLLSGLVTIFVALVGYRMVLGTTPDLRDGIGWAVRLGIVLTLATGWPAFQTVVYHVAVDGPDEIAAILLPAAGLPAEAIDSRIQQAYDTIRLGSTERPSFVSPTQDTAADGQAGASVLGPSPGARFGPLGQPALPQTASWFVISTLGMIGALRVAAGILLAVAPLAILALLFDATLGLFSGWVRALVGSALALVAATIVATLDLLMVESELGHLQSVVGGFSVVDPQALTTIVLAFAPVMLVAVWAGVRMASAFRIPGLYFPASAGVDRRSSTVSSMSGIVPAMVTEERQGNNGGTVAQTRVQSVADALATSVRREQGVGSPSGQGSALSQQVAQMSIESRPADMVTPGARSAAAGPRSRQRRTGSAARRDRRV